MASKNEITVLTPKSSYADAIAFNNGRFRQLTKEVYTQSCKNFVKLDSDSDGFLDLHDVTKMMEKLGETKTVTEVRQIIAEVDKDNDGKISFSEFLAMLAGPADAAPNSNVIELTLFGRIYGSNLRNHAAFFEQAAAATQDMTELNKQRIKEEYAAKKIINEARKAELEAQKAADEAAEQQKANSRAKLAAKAAMFEKA